jgi:hypothetical protein
MRPAPKLRLVSAFNATAYRNIATLQEVNGLTLDELQFLGHVAGNLKAGREMTPEEVARISAMRARLAREMRAPR